ncbi:copper homeostasis protein CutC [Acetonema longum]|uniref:PF03932 family protein CutC n=1 Tax=Acetonema longum DSM 6540 TaxID=1009370 RepID=F7NDI9_9FIRM|nr:copper homeostasis protein CutC [Acetonema longum]EGO65851.1 CutC family protein [Acetonema longum DSM 6540]
MIEIIATTIEDAKRIEAFGASRIELISAMSEGGLTPSYGLIKTVVESVRIPVNVMIRPHAKSFVYTEAELNIMKEDIKIARQLKANGVVLGVLDENNAVDEKSLAELLETCSGLDVTFHRAIDELRNPVKGIKVLAEYPEITTVLTSGGKGDIQENLAVIKEMVENAGKIRVLVGGGLNFENIGRIVTETGAPEYHFGTAIRDNSSAYGGINEEKLKSLIKLMNRLGG